MLTHAIFDLEKRAVGLEVVVDTPDQSLETKSSINGYESPVLRSRVLRKLDLWLLPIMFVTYGIQFLDKAMLGYAAVYTLQQDNHLEGQDYSWVTSIFYFGYLAFEYPLTTLLARFHTGRFLGFMVVAWGLTLLMGNFCNSYAGLAVNRFVLGALESVVAPTFVVVTARFYTRQEQPIRQIVWFAGTPVFGIFGGLLGYAVGNISTPSVASWSDPASARFLNAEEQVAASSLTASQGTGARGSWKWNQVKEAFIDPKTYFFLAIGFVNTIPAGALSSFSSLLIKGFGFTAVQTQLIGIPSHIVQMLALALGGVIATKIPNMRLYAMSACCIPCIIGTALVHTLPDTNTWGRVVAVWIIYTNSLSLAVSFAVIGGNVAGFTKKTTVTFVLFVGYCTGNVASPQFFISTEAKQGYPTGIKTMLACFCILAVLPLLLRLLYVRENRRRDQLTGDGEVQSDVNRNDDLTDWELKGFRYVL